MACSGAPLLSWRFLLPTFLLLTFVPANLSVTLPRSQDFATLLSPLKLIPFF